MSSPQLCSRIDDLQSLADIKDITVREFTKLEVIIQVPFRAGNQFLGEGGLQVCSLCCCAVL